MPCHGACCRGKLSWLPPLLTKNAEADSGMRPGTLGRIQGRVQGRWGGFRDASRDAGADSGTRPGTRGADSGTRPGPPKDRTGFHDRTPNPVPGTLKSDLPRGADSLSLMSWPRRARIPQQNSVGGARTPHAMRGRYCYYIVNSRFPVHHVNTS